MGDLKGKLSHSDLSSVDMSEMSDFDPRFIEDYLSMKDDISAIAQHVEPPVIPGQPPVSGLLRDDLDGDGDILTAPTSNQAYILDQKTITNATAISDHELDADNPHLTALIDLIDVTNPDIKNLFGSVPIVDAGQETLTIRKMLAQYILYDDSSIGAGNSNLQKLLEFLDDQIGLRETAATGIISGGGGAVIDPTTISVNAGSAEIVDGYTDRRNPVRNNTSWVADPAFTINMPSVLGVQAVYTDATGVLQQQSMPLSESQRRNTVQIAFVYYRNGIIESLQQAGIHSNEVGNTLYDLIYRMPFSFRSIGMGIRPVNNALSVFADTGSFFTPGISISQSLTNPHVAQFPAVGDSTTPMTFDVIFADATTVPGLANQTTIPKFWESAPGVSTALSGNDATIGYLFKTFGNTYLFQLGTQLYTNGALARDSLETDLDAHIFFDGSENTLPSAQIYNDRTSADFNDQNKAGIVSLIGSGAGSSGAISVSNWIDLTDTIPTTYTGAAKKYSRVAPNESGLDLVQLEIIDDLVPQLGGPLQTQGNDVIIQSDAVTEVGRLVDTVGGGVALARTTVLGYDANDGGFLAGPGVAEIHGGVAQVKTLAGVDNREVWVNKDGSLFSVEPPPPGFTVIDTDNGVYLIPTLGIFVQMTGLQVTIPQIVAAGEPLRLLVNVHVINGSATRGGSINIAFGINGAAPTGNGVNKVISGSLNSVVPVSITTTNHGGLAVNDTAEIWVRRSTEDNVQFDPQIDASTGGLHEMAVSNSAAGVGGITSVDGDTGPAIDLSTSYLALDGSRPMTGTLTTSGNINADQATFSSVGNHGQVTIQHQTAGLRSQILFNDEASVTTAVISANADGSFQILRLSSTDIGTTLTLQDNGNLSVNGAAPTAPDHLVRMDWAESLQDLGVRTAVGTTTNLQLTDRAGAVECANPAAINLVIDNTSTTNYPIGMQVVIVQADVGQVSIVGATAVTIIASLGKNKTAGTDDAVTIYHSSPNVWRVFGGVA